METWGLDEIHLAGIQRHKLCKAESVDVELACWVVLMQSFQ